MIGQKTALERITKDVLKDGPRADPLRDRFGFYRTSAEVRKFFLENNFNIAGKHNGFANVVTNWVLLNRVDVQGAHADASSDLTSVRDSIKADLLDDRTIVWFHDVTDRNTLMMAADRAGFGADQVVF